MKALCFGLLLFVFIISSMRADVAADRAAVEAVARAVFDRAASGNDTSALFAADADSEYDRLVEIDHRLTQRSKEPMSEVSEPHVVIGAIKLITPDVALVNAANNRYGSLVLRIQIPVLFVMRREGAEWRIVSLRVLMDSNQASANPKP